MKLTVKFLDVNDTEHRLDYLIYDTHLSKKWFDTIKTSLARPNSYVHSSLGNFSLDNIHLVYEELRTVVSKINNYRVNKLPIKEAYSTEDLNYLHAEFESWGETFTDNSTEVKDFYFLLNELIHKCEGALSTNIHWPVVSASFDIYPAGDHKTVAEEDKLYLTNSLQWGKLYLGYNTLGKDWRDISLNNDVEVIIRDMVKIQERYASECWLYFGRDMDLYEGPKQLYDWTRTLPLELQQKIPFDNLNKLSLGRFLIGEVIINDNFLKFDATVSNWKTPRHPIKLKWNKKVFSQFKLLTDVEISQ